MTDKIKDTTTLEKQAELLKQAKEKGIEPFSWHNQLRIDLPPEDFTGLSEFIMEERKKRRTLAKERKTNINER